MGKRDAPISAAWWYAGAAGGKRLRWRVLHVCRNGGLPLHVPFDERKCWQCGDGIVISLDISHLPTRVQQMLTERAAGVEREVLQVWQLVFDARKCLIEAGVDAK